MWLVGPAVFSVPTWNQHRRGSALYSRRIPGAGLAPLPTPTWTKQLRYFWASELVSWRRTDVAASSCRAPLPRSHSNSCFERTAHPGKGASFLQCSTFSTSEFAAIRDFCFYDRNDINYTLDPRLDPALFSITLLLFEDSFVRTFFFFHSLWRRRPGCPGEVWHGERGWLRQLILTVSSWVVWIWRMLGRPANERGA